MRATRKELKYNEITDKIYTDVYLEKDDNVMLECPVCKTPLKFKVFIGDSVYLEPFPCEKCIEKAIKKASLEKAKTIIEEAIKNDNKTL